MTDGPIPTSNLPLSARAPGKCIIFGEHAVVHGEPELVMAIDLHTQVGLAVGAEVTLNRDPRAAAANPYLKTALGRMWPDGKPLAITATSRIPRSAGLGSSAAFVAALGAGLGGASGGLSRELLAQESFEIERTAQGVGSPGDTSAAVAGGCVALNASMGTLLWEVTHETTRWTARRILDPGWVWVVAYSGIPRQTANAVRAVSARLAESDGPELLRRFRAVAEQGIAALVDEDRLTVARLMKENHELLKTVGVSHPRLEALIEAVAPAAQGAKLTGAGAGGSVLVLPSPGRETEAVRRLARVGAVAFAVRPSVQGATIVGSG
jgi:mevalonate kinase